MRKLIASLVFLLPLSLFAQLGSGLLAPNRQIDWSQAGAGTIPARSTVCTTLGTPGQAPTFAQPVTMAAIQSALAACPAGQAVALNPGTYSSYASLISTTSNVTLRGAAKASRPSSSSLPLAQTAWELALRRCASGMETRAR